MGLLLERNNCIVFIMYYLILILDLVCGWLWRLWVGDTKFDVCNILCTCAV